MIGFVIIAMSSRSDKVAIRVRLRSDGACLPIFRIRLPLYEAKELSLLCVWVLLLRIHLGSDEVDVPYKGAEH
jgi:hypothetical protein